MENYYKIEPVSHRAKNELAIHNEHILNKYYAELGKLARLSTIRIEVEEALNTEAPDFIF